MGFKFEKIINKEDIMDILNIYNSNEDFLKNHLGVISVSKDFIINEVKGMYEVGFESFTIRDNNNDIIGVCDYKIEDEAYLSLLMIDATKKGRGIGRAIYNDLENIFKCNNVMNVRIDVVYNYEDNVVEFWKKQGFTSCKEIELEWNGYKSKAIKMKKSIG